jgi:hypothetical protein
VVTVSTVEANHETAEVVEVMENSEEAVLR